MSARIDQWIEAGTADSGAAALADSPHESGLAQSLGTLTIADLVRDGDAADRDDASALLAGLWLLAGDLDRSHTFSQSLETPTGSYWHGIMHRRERDFGNAKYWFRRVGQHPIHEPLAAAARAIFDAADAKAITGNAGLTRLAGASTWDAMAMVDAVEMCASSQNRHERLSATCGGRMAIADEGQPALRSAAAQDLLGRFSCGQRDGDLPDDRLRRRHGRTA